MLTSEFWMLDILSSCLFPFLFREKGGAYGAGAKSSAGMFFFFSYRYNFNCVWPTAIEFL